jgi:predicted ribosomally synthesized peptide with SipW-like signal peptide
MRKLLIGVMVITLLSAVVGSSVAAFNDAEESPGNSITAWTESSPSFSSSLGDSERSQGNTITIAVPEPS